MSNISKLLPKYHITLRRGGFSWESGGWGGALLSPLSPSGIRPPHQPKGPKGYYFMTSVLGRPTLKFSQGVFGANICYFLRRAGTEKTQFSFDKVFFQKVPEKQRKILGQNRLVIVFWQCSENQFD